MAGMEIIYPGNLSLKVDRHGNAVIDETETCDSCNKQTSKAGGLLDLEAAIWVCADCRNI
jgi:ribosomal protein L37AE/L43A